MREQRIIRFRAWDKKNKKMYSIDTETEFDKYISFRGEIVYFESDDGGKNGLYEHNQCYREEEKNSVLMQYTGLKDKKGKEIYEGDIVKGLRDGSLDYTEQITQVVFKEGSFRETYFGRTLANYIHQSYGFGNTLEVIGNIYENKELLK